MTDDKTATPLTAELVEEAPSTALVHQQGGPALAPLAFQEDAVAVIERMGATLVALQSALIRCTQPEQWVVQGNGFGLLTNAGCLACAPLLRLTCEDDVTPVKTVAEDGSIEYTITGYVYSQTLGRGEEIEFTRSSIEPFLGRQTLEGRIVKKEGNAHAPDHRSATRSGFTSKAVRTLGGLKNVPEARLLEIFGPGAKARFQRGHGAGSAQDRTATNVSSEGAQASAQVIWDNLLRLHAGDVAAAGQHLKKLTAYPAGKNKSTGKPYDGFPGVDNLKQLATRNERTLEIVGQEVQKLLANAPAEREPGED